MDAAIPCCGTVSQPCRKLERQYSPGRGGIGGGGGGGGGGGNMRTMSGQASTAIHDWAPTGQTRAAGGMSPPRRPLTICTAVSGPEVLPPMER